MKRHALKLFSLLVLLSAFIQPTAFAASSDLVSKPEIKMSINGLEGKFIYGKPTIENGRSLIPVRDLLVNLGVSDDKDHIIWDEKTRTVTIIHGEITISLAVDSKDILKNGKIIQKLEVPAKIINNRVYLPARAVAEALDFSVSFDEKSQSIIITSAEPVDIKPADPNEDRISPSVVGVLALTGTQIEVVFSEPVDKETAENIANYAAAEKYGKLSALNIVTAVQQADKTKVSLTTSSQKDIILYTLAVSNVKDSNGNTIVSNSIAFLGSRGASEVVEVAVYDPAASPIVRVTPPSKNTIEILFGNPMDKASAETVANYSAHELYGLRTALAITGAKLQGDGVTVILTTNEQEAQLYALSITNVADALGNKLTLETPSTFVGYNNINK